LPLTAKFCLRADDFQIKTSFQTSKISVSFSNVANRYYIDFTAGCPFVLFAPRKFPLISSGIILVICLVITGVLNIQEAVSGFGDNIIITIAGLFVLTGGLVKTGLVDLIGRRLYRVAGEQRIFADVPDNAYRNGCLDFYEQHDGGGNADSVCFRLG
jgi:hypothetical protein